MQLKIKPYPDNPYPLGGILIKDVNINHWVLEIQRMGLNLNAITVYPIPGTKANSIWGCLIELNTSQVVNDIGKHEYCQLVYGLIFIPEKAIITPALTATETGKLFKETKYFLHPEIGMVELSEAIDWPEIIETPQQIPLNPLMPIASVNIPSTVKSFQLQSIPPEEAIKLLEQDVFPKREKLKDKPLSVFEKAKLKLYEQIFKSIDASKADANPENIPPALLKSLVAIGGLVGKKGDDLLQKMQEDFADLEERNKKEIDKLMDMLKDNPEEALKYAIPLDEKGTFRGGLNSKFELSRRWGNFSLFGNNNRTGSGGVDLGDQFLILRQQYFQTAKELIEKGAFEKAAFIYMRLLKNYLLAAQTLEKGKMYQEAASIYLKHLDNKAQAARCYEEGNYIQEAIELYKELNNNEKVGDLYHQLHNIKEANVYYQKVVEEYTSDNQYVKASLICKNKMNQLEGAQDILLEGWRKSKDAFNCLNNYFNNIQDDKRRWEAINSVAVQEVNSINRQTFLKAIRYEYKKENESAEPIRKLAYELIALEIESDPNMVSELLFFNAPDNQLVKDTITYKRLR